MLLCVQKLKKWRGGNHNSDYKGRNLGDRTLTRSWQFHSVYKNSVWHTGNHKDSDYNGRNSGDGLRRDSDFDSSTQIPEENAKWKFRD